MRRAWLLPSAAALLTLTGCINGPVRYTALGNGKFATVEFPTEAEAAVVPFAAVGGLATDAALVVPDTLSFVIVTAFVGPYETVRSTFQPDVPAWRYVALPIAIPIGALVYGIYTAVKPYNITPALGWEEGPYGSEYAPSNQRRAPDQPAQTPTEPRGDSTP